MLWMLFTSILKVSGEPLRFQTRDRERRASRWSLLITSPLGRPLANSLAALRISVFFENSLRERSTIPPELSKGRNRRVVVLVQVLLAQQTLRERINPVSNFQSVASTSTSRGKDLQNQNYVSPQSLKRS